MLTPSTNPVAPSAAGLHAPFLQACTRFADRLAIVDEAGEISYAELRRRSEELARGLRLRGVAPGDRVALLLDRSIGCIALILAVLRIGAAYIPFDPRWPNARKRQILELARPRLAVLLPGDEDALPDYQAAWFLGLERGDATRDLTGGPDAAIDGAQLAYVLYTSGTSGVPKGVAVSHAAARHFTDWTVAEFGLQAQDRVAGVSSLTFDLSVFDIFATLSAGATLYLYDHRKTVLSSALSAFMERHAISVVYSVPTTLALLAARGQLKNRRLESLRLVLFAGEPFALPQFRQLQALLPPATAYCNLYGPTETNVCTFYRVSGAEDPSVGIPIGKPIPLTRVRLDPSPAARDYAQDAGELQVFGPTLMRGYLARGADESGCWVSDPVNGERGYRTGDVCRWDAAGNLLFLGRLDSQIKVNGFRIETAEIENLLRADEAVDQCAVAATRKGGGAIALLVAFVVAKEPQRDDDLHRRLMTRCRSHLPAYQCPNELMLVDELPTTVSGKVDRKALSAMYERATRGAESVPATETSS